MKKSMLFTLMTVFCFSILLFPKTADAAGFVQDAAGIKYQNDDGSYLTDSWVQVGELWYLLDANGFCTNPTGSISPTVPVTMNNIFANAGWIPFQTTDAALLNNGIALGLIGFDGAQYWAEPTFAAQFATPEVTYAEQPDVIPQNVWLSATGNKYHRINNCGNMNPDKAVLVSLQDAIQRGITPCSNCF